MTQLEQFLKRADALLARLEVMLPQADAAPDWNAGIAFRWRKRSGKDGGGYLQAVASIAPIALSDLQHVVAQKQMIEQNTDQFVRGLPANNVLLTGAR